MLESMAVKKMNQGADFVVGLSTSLQLDHTIYKITLTRVLSALSTMKDSIPLRATGTRGLPLSNVSPISHEQAGIDDCGLDQVQSSAHLALPDGQSAAACAAGQVSAASEPESAFERIPDGGYGWIVVASCFICM